MKKSVIYIVICGLSAISLCAAAQPHTSYFVPNSTNRHMMNPALTHEVGYVGIPFLSNFNTSIVGDLSMNKLVYPLSNGQLGTFLHSEVSTDDFMKKINKNNTSSFEFSNYILEGGWRTKRDAYWTVGVGLKVQVDQNYPKSFFSFLKEGMTAPEGSHYDIQNISYVMKAYSEIYVGYSREVIPGLKVGGKLKGLISAADADLRVNTMSVDLTKDCYLASADISGTAAMKGLHFTTKPDGRIDKYSLNASELGVAGGGAAIDLGASYTFGSSSILDGLSFYLSATDIGFITNTASSVTKLYSDPSYQAKFEGAKDIDRSSSDIGKVFKEFSDNLVSMVTPYTGTSGKTVTNMLAAKLYVGADYAFLDNDQMRVGLLYNCRFGRFVAEHELMVSWNYSPVKWFNVALSYSFLNTRQSMGALLTFAPAKGLNFFIGSDYIPFKYSAHGVPVNSGCINASFGLSVPIQGGTYPY